MIRELALSGSCRFNDIQRGVPLMSSSLLTKRLRQLEQAGIVERRPRLDGNGSEYHLTPAGEELGLVIVQIGFWSERWLRRPIFEKMPDIRSPDVVDARHHQGRRTSPRAHRDPLPLPRRP